MSAMLLKRLTLTEMDQLKALFVQEFLDDHYYSQLYPDRDSRAGYMKKAFHKCFLCCLQQGNSMGVFEGDRLIAFLLCLDYGRLRGSTVDLRDIFGVSKTAQQLQTRLDKLGENVIYLISIAVDQAYHRMGLASALVDVMIAEHPGCTFAGDVSNGASLPIYRARGFQMSQMEPDYSFIQRREEPQPALGETVRLALPDEKLLDRHGIPYHMVKKQFCVPRVRICEQQGFRCFARDDDAVSVGVQVEVAYLDLLRFQRVINLCQQDERWAGDCVYYLNEIDYTEPPLLNDTLTALVKKRPMEWAVVPDLFVSVPMQMESLKRLEEQAAPMDEEARYMLQLLDFRTQYEAGIPVDDGRVDDQAGFKGRMKRIYLGKQRIQILTEPTLGENESPLPIGRSALVDMFVTVDTRSSCAVLTWFSLSAPFLISQLLDSVIRSQLVLCQQDGAQNFYTAVHARYGLTKRGTAKSWLNIPQASNCLKKHQIASLLASEMIYPEGEVFGRINDDALMEIVDNEKGLGQYDRGVFYAYTNVALQFSPGFCGTVRDRLAEQSICLFYYELLLLEEASLQIANHDIQQLFGEKTVENPAQFLKKVDVINDSYSRTNVFRNIRMNYPTTQRSMQIIRDAFRLDDLHKSLAENQEQLQRMFDTKCDIVDRRNSGRMDGSLAVISFLAVFSALIDSYDYADAWKDVLSGRAVWIIQRVLFVLIMLTALYALGNIFGGRILRFWRRLRQGNKKR